MLTATRIHPDERGHLDRPLRVGLIGLGAFGRTALTQLGRIGAVQIVAVADADHIAVREVVDRAGIRHPGLITDEVDILLGAQPDVVVEASGVAVPGVGHAAAAIAQGCHVIMANSAADALAGYALARRARAAGVVYSLAQGDRPALICGLVTWARANGFDVVAAGRGAPHRRGYRTRTPDTVWELFDHTEEEIRERGFSARNVTALIDGTQSAMEMASVANACGLVPQSRGLLHPACGSDRLAEVLVPQSVGGVLERAGTVEVASTLLPDGTTVENDLRNEVFVTLSASTGYVARMFRDYGLATDPSGRFASLHRPVQPLGLEAPASVLAAGSLGEDTGAPTAFVAEVAAVAKHDLSAGQTLDGVGGYTVYGRLMPAQEATGKRVLPIGLADGRKLVRSMPAGSLITCDDVDGGPFPPEAVAMRPGMVPRPREREHIVVSDRMPGSVASPAGATADSADDVVRAHFGNGRGDPSVETNAQKREESSPADDVADDARVRVYHDTNAAREDAAGVVAAFNGWVRPSSERSSANHDDGTPDGQRTDRAMDEDDLSGPAAVPGSAVADDAEGVDGGGDLSMPAGDGIPVPGFDEGDDETATTGFIPDDMVPDDATADEDRDALLAWGRVHSTDVTARMDEELIHALQSLSEPEIDDDALDALFSDLSDHDRVTHTSAVLPETLRSVGAADADAAGMDRHAERDSGPAAGVTGHDDAGDAPLVEDSPDDASDRIGHADADGIIDPEGVSGEVPETSSTDDRDAYGDSDPWIPPDAPSTMRRILLLSNGGEGGFMFNRGRRHEPGTLPVPDPAGTPTVTTSENERPGPSGFASGDASSDGEGRPIRAPGADGRDGDEIDAER